MQFDGTDWVALGTGVDDYVYSAFVHRGSVYFGGWLQQAGSKTVEYIGEWNGKTWSALPAAGLDNAIFAITGDDESLYFGGYISEAGGMNAWRLAKFDVENSSVGAVIEPPAQMLFDPVARKVLIESADRYMSVVVTDLLGRTVSTIEPHFTGERSTAQLPELTHGVYLIKFVGEKSVTGRIVY
jgi:hypothetical protein